ncbi:hypothetical protein [Neobacillus niacini]|uniref:hypothetical protein n=1 Tax=Neobacillus niacini TaxID=86668 RepID=UPI002FFD8B07
MFNIKVRKLYKRLSFILNKILPKNIYIYIFYYCSYVINSFTVIRAAKKYGLKRLKHLALKDYKKSDTLFILGSGKSIEDLTPAQWAMIKENDSLGLNFWLYHEFVPTFYVYEESLNVERNNLFYKLLRQKQDMYKDTPFIVKDIEYKGITFDSIPSELTKNIYLSTEMVVFGGKIDFSRFLYRGYLLLSKFNKRNKNVLLKRSGSLSYLLFLAENFGYRNIVLCGIDLINSDYFYYNPKYSVYSVPDNKMKVQNRHLTDVETKGNIPISTVVTNINEQVFKRKGINLFVGSKDSALFPMFDCYFDYDQNR